jgi:choline kinase
MKTTCEKAIIVAAGRGRRLGENTDEMPKCMVPVAGRPILHWQLRALRAAGIHDIVIVRGYQGTRIDAGDLPVRFVDNPEWEHNNILASLLYAIDAFSGGFYFSYCDIVYSPKVVTRLVERTNNERAGSLVIDRRWSDAYAGRSLHPVSEAELASVEDIQTGSRVARVGKGVVPAAQAQGEFIGLAHFSPTGADALVRTWRAAMANGGLCAPFGRARSLRQAYLTDAINAIADEGACFLPVFIDGEWREIDTPQDLSSAELAVHRWAG